MEENNKEKLESGNEKEKFDFGNWHDKYYKILLFIPLFFLILSLIYLGFFYSKNGSFFYKDVSLSGGTTITINGNFDSSTLEEKLSEKFSDVYFTKLTDTATRRQIALLIESSAPSEELKSEIESILGYELDDSNSSIEFTGSTLSESFYKQLIVALIISFVFMSLVIFIMFRNIIPSLAVIFAVFADIVMPLALVNLMGVKLSAAGIAAFLMLIGYSVDTDILLTTRVLKNRENKLNSRIFGAFKTGILMTLTALAAVLPAFFLITGLPESFRQIFLILGIGLSADIINTWLTNVGLIKWYCEKKEIK